MCTISVPNDVFVQNLGDKIGIEEPRILGARYNYGTSRTLEQLKTDLLYGNFIVKNWHSYITYVERSICRMTKIKILSIVSSLAYLVGVLFIYALRGGEYDWMLEITPDIGSVPESSDDWLLLSKFALAFTLATQAPMLFTKNRKYHLVMIVMAVIFYVLSGNH